jgi:hypothetical protein
MADVALAVRFTGDSSGLRNEVKLTKQSLEELNRSSGDGKVAAEEGRRVTEEYAKALKGQYETLGDLDAAQRKFMDAVNKTTDAHKAAGDAVDKTRVQHESLTGAMFKGISAVELVRRAWDRTVETFHEMVAATAAAQASHARLEAVLRATGDASGEAAERVERLVESMARTTQFDDTSLRDAATTIATFGRVSEDARGKILKLAADMAATGRGDLQTWVTVLSKAGTEPAEAIGLVERSFAKLDPQLKVAIQNAADYNDKVLAQDLLMNALSRTVGGTAQDSYRGLTRQVEGTKKAWDEFLRAMGTEIFSAKSREASVFEDALNHMSDTFRSRVQAMKDVANSVPDWMLVMMGLPSRGQMAALRVAQANEAGMSPLDRQIAELEGAIAAGNRNGGDTSMLENQLRGALLRAIQNVRQSMPDPWQSEPGFAPPGNADKVTDLQRQALNSQELTQQSQLVDQIYRIRQEGVQRQLQLEQYRHDMGIEGESTYFARVAQLGAKSEQDDVERVRREIAIAQQQLNIANTEVARANAGGKPDEIYAALGKQAEAKTRLKSLTLDLGAAEAKVGDAEKKRAVDQYQSDVAWIERNTAIKHQLEDTQRALDQGTADLQQQLDLMGKTDEQAAELNNQYKLATQLKAEQLKLERQIADLKFNADGKDHTDEIAQLEERLKNLPDLYKKVGDAQAEIIKNTFGLRDQLKVWNDLADIGSKFFADLLVNGRSAFDRLRDSLKSFLQDLIAVFAKRWILQLAASATGSSVLGSAAQGVGQGTLSGSVASGVGNWLGSTAIGSYFSGAGEAFMAGYQGSTLLAGGSATDQLMNTFGQYVAEFGGYIMAATGIIAGVATSYGLYNAGWTGKPGTATLGMNDLGRVTGTPIWSPAGMIAGFTDRGLHGLGFSDRNAAILSGTTGIQRLFGWKDPHADAYGVSGQITGGDVTGQNWQDMSRRGGLFRSDQRWTDTAGLSSGQQDTLGQMMSAVSGIISSLGHELGVNVSQAIASYTQSFNVQLSNDGKPRSDAEIQQEFTDIFAKTLQEQMALVFDASGDNNLARYVRSLQGAGQDITQAIANLLAMRDAVKELGDTIATVQGGPVEALNQQMHGLDKSVSDAQEAFARTLGGNDLGAINAAEAQLEQQVLNRYNTEISMVRQIQAAIEGLKQQAYEFAVQIAQRINQVGGSRDIGGIALAHATSLQSGIGGVDNPAGQMANLQNYVGSIDTWYQAHAAAIQHDVQQQAAQAQANAAADQAIAQARVQASQTELQLVQQWQQLADQLTKQIDAMRLTGVNPASAAARLQLSQGDADAARAAYEHASGQGRVDAAGRYADALQTELGLLGDVFQRPSPEYQSVYNDIISQLTAVRDQAQTEGDRAEDLQAQLVMLQQQANSVGQASFDVQAATDAAMSSLNEEALGYYTYAEQEGQRLYALQQAQQQELLTTITHGMDPNFYIAMKQQEAVALLAEIRDALTGKLNGLGTATPTDTGTGTSSGYKPQGNGSLGNVDVPVLKDQPVQLILNEKVFAEFTLGIVRDQVSGALLPIIKRGLQTA